jgi:hypothetical protein
MNISISLQTLTDFVVILNGNPFGSICLIILAVLAVAGLFLLRQ